MLAAIAASGAACLPRAVAQDAADCEAARTTAIPYELRMRQGDGGTYPVQVYRGKNLTRMQVTKAGAHLVISRFQANCVSARDPDADRRRGHVASRWDCGILYSPAGS